MELSLSRGALVAFARGLPAPKPAPRFLVCLSALSIANNLGIFRIIALSGSGRILAMAQWATIAASSGARCDTELLLTDD